MSRAVPTVEYENAEAIQLGKYRLLALIARGGMGDIYLAMSEGPAGFRKLVVVKVLRTDAEEEEAYRSMFLDEGMLAARLGHPNVVQTHEVGESGGQLYIAMEYLEGQPLSRLMRAAGRMPGPLSARIVADALAGLEYAHELRDFDGSPLNIVHRDLSPQNVFVTYDGVTKLVDFGIAKAALTTRAMTEVGVLKGKISYMAPEQANSGVVDRRADVFAMGIVLWELVTGRRLFDPRYTSQCLRALLDAEPFARISVIHPDSDPVLDGVVARALEKDPARRYQTAGEMRAALEAYLAHAEPSTRNEHIAQFLLGHFAQQRATMQQQVRACVAGVQPTSERRLPAIGVRPRSITDSSGMTNQKLDSGRTSGEIHVTGRVSTESPSPNGDAPWGPDLRSSSRLRSKRLIAAGAFAGLLGVVGAVVLLSSQDRAQEAAPLQVSIARNSAAAPVRSALAQEPSVPASPAVHPAPAEPEVASAPSAAARERLRAPRGAATQSFASARTPPVRVLAPAPAAREAVVPIPAAPPAKRRVELVDDVPGVELVE